MQLEDETTGVTVKVSDDGAIQTVTSGMVDANNTTVVSLGADETFTGAATEVLDYANMFVNVSSDQDSAIDGLTIEQSVDGVNWIYIDKMSIEANSPKQFSYGCANAFMRVTYTNGTVSQSNFDLSVILKKTNQKASSHRIQGMIVNEDDAELVKSVITGLTDDGEFINIGSTTGGSLKTSQEDGQTGIRLDIDPLGSMKSVTPVRLVGTAFNNGSKDPNFWTESIVGSGVVAQAGQISLSTGTIADSSATYDSVRKARKVPGSVNEFRMVGRLITVAEEDNVRRAGPYNDNDGYFFQYNGLTFGVGSRKISVDNIVENGNFNGNYGATIDVSGTSLYRFVIDYTSVSARFFIDGILLHTMTFPVDVGTNTVDFPIRMENYNENGNTTNNEFQLRFATILRLGELITNPAVKYIGTATTTICKYGAGIIHSIINNDNAGSCIVYDGIDATGPIIASIDLVKVLGSLPFGEGAPFSDGLTIVTVGGAKITVVYE